VNFDKLGHTVRSSSGFRRKRAWRKLVQAGDAGTTGAVDAMWLVWLLTRDVEAWECLLRWRERPGLINDVFRVILRPQWPERTRKAVLEFCVQHELVPDEQIDHVLVLVLSGRSELAEALDPDASMLATGYRHADPVVQTELRKAMVESGSTGFARLIADQRDLVEVSEHELNHVTSRLVEEQDWPRLWRMARTLRLDQAVRAVQLITGWRPSDEAGRDMFDLLVAADPDLVSTVVESAFTQIETHENWRSEKNLSVAPDGSQIALVITPNIAVFALPSGRKVWSSKLPGKGDLAGGGVVHTGDAVVHIEPGQRLAVYSGPEWRKKFLWAKNPRGLRPVPGGFVVNDDDGVLGFGSADSDTLRFVTAADIGLKKGITGYAVEPATGRMAVVSATPAPTTSGYVLLSVLDSDLTVLGQSTTYALANVRFFDQDRLISTDHTGRTSSWRVADGELVLDAHQIFEGSVTSPIPGGPLKIVSRWDPDEKWVDPVTLEPVAAPNVAAPPLYTSPDGVHAVFERETAIEVRDLRLHDAAEMLTRPLTEVERSHMPVVSSAIERADAEVKPVLELLQAFLEYRLGSDIAIGPVGKALADDDIALGGS
jgi:hypothetical protein